MTRWVALLRGINVGGHNTLPMAELRTTIAELGFEHVVTHIQSGNVVFDAVVSPAPSSAAGSVLGDRIAGAISARHGLVVPVVVRSAAQLVRIADAHPHAPSGVDPTLLHVLFLDRTPEPEAADSIERERYLPDSWTLDGAEIYVSYPNGSGRSKLTIQVFERALGVTATARNLNTVRRLAELAASSGR